MKILLDCDVLLDVLAGRQQFLPGSARVLDGCEQGKVHGAVAWHTLANIYYLADDPKKTLQSFEDLLAFIEVVGGDTKMALDAIHLGFSDFEDALQSVCAAKFEADFIITRNLKDYKLSPVKAMSPADFVEKFLTG